MIKKNFVLFLIIVSVILECYISVCYAENNNEYDNNSILNTNKENKENNNNDTNIFSNISTENEIKDERSENNIYENESDNKKEDEIENEISNSLVKNSNEKIEDVKKGSYNKVNGVYKIVVGKNPSKSIEIKGADISNNAIAGIWDYRRCTTTKILFSISARRFL